MSKREKEKTRTKTRMLQKKKKHKGTTKETLLKRVRAFLI